MSTLQENWEAGLGCPDTLVIDGHIHFDGGVIGRPWNSPAEAAHYALRAMDAAGIDAGIEQPAPRRLFQRPRREEHRILPARPRERPRPRGRAEQDPQCLLLALRTSLSRKIHLDRQPRPIEPPRRIVP